MAYIGKQPQIGNYIKCDAITTSATTTFNLTSGGVAVYPQTATNCIVSLNGIIQAPTDAYTISGSTIVFASALTTSDVIDFITVLGDVLNIGTPSDSTVSLAKLTATGTKDSTTFLRGDNTFAVPAGKILQVVTATDSTERSTTSTSYVTGSNTLSVSITPASTSNKILILVSFLGFQGFSNGNRGTWSLYRGSTNLTTNGIMYNDYNASAVNVYIGYSYLDSPNTTSATTYQPYMKISSGTVYMNVGNSVGTITALEIAG